jgi:glycosyltransferase involved in cell wall biosynthesis
LLIVYCFTMKVIAILPAHNARNTVLAVIRSLPKGVFDAIIVSDDCSADGTWEYLSRIRRIIRIQTLRNLGYGGNVKYCLSKALSLGADIIVEIHPDGEYGVDGIVPAIREIKKGAQLVLGNRYMVRTSGMYWWKYIGTKTLTCIDNVLLGRIRNYIPDIHQGFRVYTRKLLESANYRAGGNGYIFSFQIIVAAIFRGCTIASVPVSARYTGSKRGARADATFRYACETFGVLFRYCLHTLGLSDGLFDTMTGKMVPDCPVCRNNFLVSKIIHRKQHSVYLCQGCANGFTYPAGDTGLLYRQEYYGSSGVVDTLKKTVYKIFQRRRVIRVKQLLPGGTVVDVGSGEGVFGRGLGEQYTCINIETPFAHVSGGAIIRTNFLSWKPEKPADAVVFWESLEHTENPRAYLAHAGTILKSGGFIFVEYPRFSGLESRLFGGRWYHLDLPRHRTHLTDSGIPRLTHPGFLIIYTGGIWAPEYAFVGFAASLLGLSPEQLVQNMKNPLFILVCLPVFVISCFAETLLAILGESPIGLIILKKT